MVTAKFEDFLCYMGMTKGRKQIFSDESSASLFTFMLGVRQSLTLHNQAGSTMSSEVCDAAIVGRYCSPWLDW